MKLFPTAAWLWKHLIIVNGQYLGKKCVLKFTSDFLKVVHSWAPQFYDIGGTYQYWWKCFFLCQKVVWQHKNVQLKVFPVIFEAVKLDGNPYKRWILRKLQKTSWPGKDAWVTVNCYFCLQALKRGFERYTQNINPFKTSKQIFR